MIDRKSNKKDFPVIKPKGIEQGELFELIKDYQEITSENKKLTKKVGVIKNKLSKLALSEYLDKYQEDNQNPGSIIIEAMDILTDEIGQYLFVPQDRYISIKTEEEADEIEQKYGKGVVSRKITHSINPDMLEKYSSVISDLITNSEEIEQEDKGKIFNTSEVYSISDGTINKLNLLQENDIKEVFNGIRPVVSIRDAKIIKS